MEIDKEFWNDLDIEKDLISECVGLRYRVPIHLRMLKGARHVFYNIYSYIITCIISKI